MYSKFARNPWSWFGGFLASWSLAFTINSCAPSQGEFLGVGGDILLVSSGLANHLALSAYDLDSGTLIGRFITDLRAEGDTPRGIAPFDRDFFVVAGETSDSLYKIGLDGTKTIFHSSGQLTGNLFDVERGPDGTYYAIETNNIEMFDRNGVRISTAPIATTIGACTLNTPRAMKFNANGHLTVTNTGGTGPLNIYNVSNLTAITCSSSVAVGNGPVGIVQHSNGNLYIGTITNDRIISATATGGSQTTVWNTNTAVISDPVAIVEHPSGDLLVASNLTSSIERITTAGVRVGSVPFIRDALSLSINDMVIIRKEDGNEQ